MAKKRKSTIRRFFAKARKSYKRGGMGGMMKQVIDASVSGAVYALASMAAGMVPVGLDGRIKRILTIALLWFLGGVFRKAAYVGVAFEVASLTGTLAGGLIAGNQEVIGSIYV